MPNMHYRRSAMKPASYQKKWRQSLSKARKSFSIAEFVLQIIPSIKYIILAAMVGAIGAGLYAYYCITPLYTATAKLYILGENKLDISSSAYRSGNMLAMDYQEVFQTWEVRKSVQSKLELEGSYKGIDDNCLTIYNPAKTRVLYISYTSENPQYAAETANAFAAVGKEFMLQKLDKQQPNVFSIAIVPSEIAGIGKKTYIVMGGILGATVMLCILFLKFTLDDRPKAPEDIRCTADIPILAVVPLSAVKCKKERKR